MKRKYFLIFLFSLAILQIADYIFYRTNLYQLNYKFVFGFIGNNILAAIVAIVFLALIYLIIPKSKYLLIPFVILSSAVFSNILDRIIYDGIIDYIKIWFIPMFNLADILIVATVILISCFTINSKI